MTEISATTHKFCRGKVLGDGTCLYWCGLLVFKRFLLHIISEDLFNIYLTEILDKDLFKWDIMQALNYALRASVTDYIREHEEMHDIVINSTNGCYSVAKYCSLIEDGDLWGGAPELRILSNLYNTLICVISLEKDKGKPCARISCYGEDNERATRCTFILYDKAKGHFDPLYVVNTQNLNEKETIFERNDITVVELLKKFIKEDLKCDGNIKFDFFQGDVAQEVTPPKDDSNEFANISTLLLPNLSMKRKASELEDIVTPPNEDKQLPVSVSDEYYDKNKRVKIGEDNNEQCSKFYEDQSESMRMESLIQTEFIANESDEPVNEQQIEDLPMVPDEEHKEDKMDLEIKSDDELDDGDKLKYDDKLSKAQSSS